MNETASASIVFALCLVPYAAVSWAYAAFVDGGWPDFWKCFGVLTAVRLFFSVIEGMGGILVWRIYGRSVAVAHWLKFFRENNFPPKEYASDDFGNYRARLMALYKRPTDVPYLASEIESLLLSYEQRGILVGMRMNAAIEEAFRRYQATQPPAAKADPWTCR
jgi:hypothetical protein